MRSLLAIAVCSAWAVLPARDTVIRPFQASPAASVAQDLGICSVKIDYHRPAVHGRKIWGGLVPFGQVWRAGANEATTIALSEPVRVEGRDLAAGTYTFFAIPGPDQWTLIFNRVARQWGAFSYQPAQDALRVQARPHPAPAQEYLAYTIQVSGPESLRVELAWDTLAVGFDLALAAHDRYWDYLRKALAGAGPEEWQPLNQGAAYCLRSDSHLDQGMAWIERSIAIKEGYRNLSLKAQLVKRAGRTDEARALLEKAMAAGPPKQALDELKELQAQWAK
jgi:Protein of unknown function (DUF2911)